MAKLKLIKIAKELNVGTSTIVEHLLDKGFEIENKPTAKISDEMHAELLKEFQKSIAIKEKADSLVIGNRLNTPSTEKEPPASDPKPKVQQKPPVEPIPAPAPVVKEKAKKPDNSQQEQEKEAEKKNVRGLKVLGKIDLGGIKKKSEAAPVKEEATAKKEVDSPKEETVAPTLPPPVKEDKPSALPEEKVPATTVEEPAAETAKPVDEVPEDKVKEEPVKETEKEVSAPPASQMTEEEKEAPQAKEEAPGKEVPEQEVPDPKVEAVPDGPVVNEEKPKPNKGKAKPERGSKLKQAPVSASKEGEPQPSAEAASETPEATEEKPTENKLIRAEAPELRGLKIQGKIDLNKFERPKKKKKQDKKKDDKKEENKKPADKKGQGSAQKSGGSSTDDVERKKRRRKRKKVNPSESGGGGNRGAQQRGGGGRGNASNRRRGNRRDDEPKEVSQKEIEEKIKATMARISGAGKKKRQKMRRDNRERLREKQEIREQEMVTDKLQVTEFISVQELANLMDVPVTDVIMACMNLGVIVSINQRLDAEIIELVADEFNHEIEFISAEESVEEEDEIIDDPEDLQPRAPIVTVMGHVDHGKTSLLDHIRQANVAEGEAGGITQHIGAYEVRVGEDKKKITFLDTPGHEAFTAMRARGAKVTDIAIIIIAADDSIMPQTREAISHAQAADVPIVFAINKVDKPGAQPERIKQELASMNLLVEEWGGKYQSQDISAKTGLGIPELLEKILLEAEIQELQANPDREAIGTVIEASLDKGRGYVTKMLIQTGTLKIGDSTVAGEHSGKVKAMFNERGKRIKQAGPSSPVLVLGLSGAPQAGERFKVVDSEQEARQIASKRMQIAREQANRATKRISLDEIGRRLALGNFKELNLIVKGDVDGSVEALSDSLIKQSIETVQVNVLHKAVGQIVESDVLLASASDAIIIGFQVRPSGGARKLAEREGVQIKTYSIIYEAIEEIRAAIEGMLEPTKEERIIAQLEVRNTFKISKVGTVAGCYVTDGKIQRNSKIRLIRNGIVVYPIKEAQVGELASLKRFKDDVREVKNGMECGLNIKNFNDIKVGDVIEAYEIVEIKQTLD
jgi:translation initiation factor IF-2